MSKKIAILGNMNNIPSVTARVLLDNGYQVTIFLLNEYGHFLPDSDTHEPIVNLKIINLDWDKDDIINLKKSEILKKIGGYDFYIGVEWAPAIAFKAGIYLNIFYVMGTDLSDYPFYNTIKGFPKTWQLKYFLLAKQQFYGIKYAQFLSMNPSSEYLENQLKKIEIKGVRIVGIPYLYLTQYTDSYLQKSKYRQAFDDIRKQNDFIIFHHVRHEWITAKNTIHDKGNHILLESLKDIIAQYPTIKIALITLAYGTDVEASKTLIKQFGIEKNVYWMPTMQKKDLLYGLKVSDIFVGQLISKFSAYTSLFEALSMKKMVIHNGFENSEKLYPFLNASNNKILTEALNKCLNKEIDYEAMGEKSFDWIKQNGFEIPVNTILQCLKNKQNDFKIRLGNLHCFFLKMVIPIVFVIEKILFKLSFKS